MSVHSKLSASSMHRWMHCPGSVRLSEGLERKTNVYAEEGTKAHEIAAHVLNGKRFPKGLEHEMRVNVGMYVDYVKELRKGCDLEFIEQEISVPDFHPDYFGTCDCIQYRNNSQLLRVIDFKYGKGHKVHAVDNVQLLYYALGAYMILRLPVKNISIIIVQPRTTKQVEQWDVTPIELLNFASDFLTAAERTTVQNAELKIGDYCYFCPALDICPEQHRQKNQKAREEFAVGL